MSVTFKNTILRSWNPLDLNPVGWFSALDINTITLNGSDVSAWNDKSGNGYHVTQTTAEDQPVYNATGLNGLPTIEFTTANTEWLQGAGLEQHFKNEDSPFTVFVVLENGDPDGSSYFASMGYSGATSPQIGFIGKFSNVSTAKRDNASTLKVSGSCTGVKPGIFTFKTSISGTKINIYDRGTIERTAVDFDVGSLSNLNQFAIGALRISSTLAHYNGKISELIFYDKELSDSDRESVETYLSTKWGIALQ